MVSRRSNECTRAALKETGDGVERMYDGKPINSYTYFHYVDLFASVAQCKIGYREE